MKPLKKILAEVANLGGELDEAKKSLADLQNELQDITLSVPNLPDDAVPTGKDEDENVEVSRWGSTEDL